MTPRRQDSARFGITSRGDTFTVQRFNTQHQLTSQLWRSDSFIRYDTRQLPRFKAYKLHEEIMDSRHYFSINFIEADSCIQLYSNGQPQHVKVNKKPLFYEKAFNPQGQLTYFKNQKRDPSVFYHRETDGKGMLWHAVKNEDIVLKNDTFSRVTDTFFYPNHQIRQLKIKEKHAVIRHELYSENGVLIESFSPDSLILTPFKDNIDCLYGFKNAKNDTIVRPKYERIEKLDNYRFAVYEGNSCVLLRNDGALIPTPPMSNLSQSYPERLEILERIVGENTRYTRQYLDEMIYNEGFMLYFFYDIDGKKGIIDRYGHIIMPPQYLMHLHDLLPNDLSGSRIRDSYSPFVGEIKYIGFTEYYTKAATSRDEFKRSGYLNRQGQSIFDERFESAGYTQFKDYFIVQKTRRGEGLMRENGESVLPTIFASIHPVLFTPLFVVLKFDTLSDQLQRIKSGLFNADTRTWLLDTADCTDIVDVSLMLEAKEIKGRGLCELNTIQYFIFLSSKTKKKGLIDREGRLILPPQYDELRLSKNTGDNFFWYKKNKEYGIFNPLKPQLKLPTYTFLEPLIMSCDYEFSKDVETYFAARNQHGKWGVIRGKDAKIILPFHYEYGSLSGYDNLILVKHTQATFLHTNYFFSKKMSAESLRDTTLSIYSHRLIDNYNILFFLKPNGKVAIPPQYKAVESGENQHYITVENKKGERKMVLTQTGDIINYSEKNAFRYYDGNKPLITIRHTDTAEIQENTDNFWQKNVCIYARKTGQPLTDKTNYGIAIGSPEAAVFFVKRDTPRIPKQVLDLYRVCDDTLHFEDDNWLMYSEKGQLLDTTPFRFPIDFKHGLGVGMQGDKMGIFRTDGTALVPPQYPKIWRDKMTEFYYTYDYRGLNSFISVLDKHGKMCINNAEYSRITPFRGKYTFLESNNKIGLIDTACNEIVSPQDLKMCKIALMDTFAQNLDWLIPTHPYEEKLTINNDFSAYFNFGGYNDNRTLSDTLKVPSSLRNEVGNLLLETYLDYFMSDRTLQKINRVNREDIESDFEKQSTCHNSGVYRFYDDNTVFSKRPIYSAIEAFRDTANQATYLSFLSDHYPMCYVNYIRKKDRWALLNNATFLTLTDQNKTDLYNLLVKKIRALRDVDIDCNNSNSLIKQAQTQFLLTREGIVIYLNSRNIGHTQVTLSWSELTPFL